MDKSGPTIARFARKRASSSSQSRASGTNSSDSSAVRESSGKLISSLWKMSQKRGIKRDTIFRKNAPRKIYAYYVLSSDPSKMVREDAKGEKLIGRVTNGKFRVLKPTTR